MKNYRNYLYALGVALTQCLITGCSDEYQYDVNYSYYKDAKLIIGDVNENNIIELHITPSSSTYTVKVSTDPEDIYIDPAAYTYKIEDTSIAEISQADGVISMLKEGETKLFVSFRGNHEIATECRIKIIKDAILCTDIKAPENVEVQKGKTINLAEMINILPVTADNKTLIYSSANEAVATISEEGIITGVSEGNTEISVSTTDGSNITKIIEINVLDKILVQEINLGKVANLGASEKKLPVGQSFNIGAEGLITISPSNASDKSLKFEIISDNNVASIDDNGMLRTLANGTATIKVSSTDGNASKEVTITVDSSVKWYERLLWTVETSYLNDKGQNYVPDGSTGKPEDILDGKSGTYLSIRKPEHNEDFNTEIFFIVDAGSEIEFNTIKYQHRNTNKYLAAYEIEVSGSNDGTSFTVIKSGIKTPYSTTSHEIALDGNFNYRFIKVKATDWEPYTGSSGTSVQIGEFGVAKK